MSRQFIEAMRGLLRLELRHRSISAEQIGQFDRETGRIRVRTHEMEGAFRPVPSPDGRWLVFATRYDARQALKLLDLETGAERWLVMDVQRDDSEGGGSRDRGRGYPTLRRPRPAPFRAGTPRAIV